MVWGRGCPLNVLSSRSLIWVKAAEEGMLVVKVGGPAYRSVCQPASLPAINSAHSASAISDSLISFLRHQASVWAAVPHPPSMSRAVPPAMPIWTLGESGD